MDTTKSIAFIKLALNNARRPAVLWSGGKDSTVLLDLALQVNPEIEVIHWKLPFLPQKYQHHHSVQERTGITVHDWPPTSISLTHGNDRIDVCETYQVGDGLIKVMRGTERPEDGKPWVCGRDWFNRPKVNVYSDFDVLLSGHKNCDIDPVIGSIPLEVDRKHIGNNTFMWFPIRNWTDNDVAEYILSNNIEFDKNRYSLSVVSKEDKHLNSDYIHACFKCMDRREKEFVHCPKHNIDIENIHTQILHEEPIIPYCNVRTNGLSELRGVLQSQVELADS